MKTGFLKRWVGDRGFGFITPDDGTADLFAHIHQKAGLPDETITEGRRVSFESEIDMMKGKPKALSWAFLEGGAPPALPPALAPVTPVGGWPTACQQQSMGTSPASSLGGAVDYQALVQAANCAAAALSAQGQAPSNELLASIAGLAGAFGTGTAPAAGSWEVLAGAFGSGAAQDAGGVAAAGRPVLGGTPAPPPPPRAIRVALEQVEVPTQAVADILGQAGAGLEDIKRRAGGDVIIELAPAEAHLPHCRMVKIRGPPVSASLGACLVMERVAEVVV